MPPHTLLSLCHVLVLALHVSSAVDFDWTKNEKGSFQYGTFPTAFSWGAGSSAYQTEGAWDKDGKGMSIWDVFSHKRGKIYQNDTGDSSCESYYKLKDDVLLMKDMKLNHYRFSISWPRILPTGIKADQINEKGIQHYDNLINMLLENQITPIVTLYHWDLPQVLQENYGGWQNSSMVGFFDDYANLCFETFGNRVKHWITFNHPWSIAVKGYETGEHAPGLKLKGKGAYRAAHNIIKAHAKAWHTYDIRWRSKQKGMVGISLSTDWGEPVDITNLGDIEAADRYMEFHLGWFAAPVFSGDYPQIMKEYVGKFEYPIKSAEQGLGDSRLPTFSPQEKSYIKGTCDFLGLGHFTTRYITQKNFPSNHESSFFTDRELAELVDPLWPDPGSEWLYSVPWGFRRLLHYVKTQYGNPIIYVTENGVSEKIVCTDLCDEWRLQYFRDYINEMLKAVYDGVNVKGYTAWSLLDMFEWDEGYSERFGLYYVDFGSKNKKRYPKASVQFYKRIISSNGFPNQREIESWKRKSTETCTSSNQLLAADPLISHMELVTEIVVPTVENGLFGTSNYDQIEDESFPPLPPPLSPGEGYFDEDHAANGEGEGELSKLPDVPVAKRRTVKRPQPKLDSQRLLSERGLPALRTLFSDVKFKGKGHEAEDLKVLMKKMENWAHRLYPKLQFEDFMDKLEVLGNKKEVQTCLKRIRLDMPLIHEDFTGNDGDEAEVRLQEDADPFEDRSFSEDPFIHSTPAPALVPVSLTEEQQQRIERNKQLALEKRLARQKQLESSQSAFPDEPFASPTVHHPNHEDQKDLDQLPDETDTPIKIQGSSQDNECASPVPEIPDGRDNDSD
ncbi:Lactase-like protein [Bagarius yarrelli]|uniref:Cytosolic beta-glucosidase n=1 Tax=Bagarius yarrelli TaxID=175774 RepID=A0A556TLC0_BAGYA|nr:Lactase-like protein [Bagarius yarrelli]